MADVAYGFGFGHGPSHRFFCPFHAARTRYFANLSSSSSPGKGDGAFAGMYVQVTFTYVVVVALLCQLVVNRTLHPTI